jgi:hypothetical protein
MLCIKVMDLFLSRRSSTLILAGFQEVDWVAMVVEFGALKLLFRFGKG